MLDDKKRIPTPRPGAPDLDELQRGHEKGITVETIERMAPAHYGEQREMPIPEPGDRPGAVCAGESPRETSGEREA
jgi:hypothetical protein